ncbi:MAG TPA: mechanosensitive ion channel family protein [Chryseolinea sp.]
MNDTLTYQEIPGQTLFDKILYLNSFQDYLIGLFLLAMGIAGIKIIRNVIHKQLRRSGSPFLDYFRQIEKYVYPLAYVALFMTVFQWFTVTVRMAEFTGYAFKIVLVFLGIRLLTAGVRTAIYSYLSRQDQSGDKAKQVRGIVIILNGVLWIMGTIFLFDNLGFNVTAVLTGLGVGGIAIALAAQTILGDIFNYFVIFFDRPFEVGDFIIVDDKMGTVEYIGLKTTRITSLSGEQIVISNSNLTNSRLHNYKRMQERRILFRFGITYETDTEKVERIPELVRGIIEKLPQTRFDRTHFVKFGDYSLDYEVVFYVLSADYNRYMDIQQAINIELLQTLAKEGVEFAYPTYSLRLPNRRTNLLEAAPFEVSHQRHDQ